MGESAISIKGLKKDYNVGAGEVHALRGIDMEIACGEFVCIAGKSGSGKSTLLNLVAGLESDRWQHKRAWSADRPNERD